MAAALLVMGLGFVILTVSHSIPPILVGVLFVGFGQGVLFPIVNVKVLGTVAPEISDKVISIISSMIYVGQFVSPLVLDYAGKLMNNPTIRFQYTVLGVSLIISVLGIMIYKFVLYRQRA